MTDDLGEEEFLKAFMYTTELRTNEALNCGS